MIATPLQQEYHPELAALPRCRLHGVRLSNRLPGDCPLRAADIATELEKIQAEAYSLYAKSGKSADGEAARLARARLAKYQTCYACWGSPAIAPLRRQHLAEESHHTPARWNARPPTPPTKPIRAKRRVIE